MRGVLADTGPLYALIDRDDQLHPRARREVLALEAQGVFPLVATPVLTEGYDLVLRGLVRTGRNCSCRRRPECGSNRDWK